MNSTEWLEILCFNSRTLGRVRLIDGWSSSIDISVSIHAPWEGCDDANVATMAQSILVSIHAPWEGCDSLCLFAVLSCLRVSIHAPWEGCDGLILPKDLYPGMFQFTHPGKGATSLYARSKQVYRCFNSRTLGRVRRHNIAGWYFRW